MHIEFRHLRTIKAIYEEGGLARAAERLYITQSALSHQVKGLEEQAGVELFVRRSKPLKLSPAGIKLLELAEDILPKVEALEDEFRGIEDGVSGRLHIALECHACFDWLIPVLDKFRQAWPEIDVDIKLKLNFDSLESLDREEVDLVVTSDSQKRFGIDFQPIFDYSPTCLMSSRNPLAQKEFLVAEDFKDQTLIAYPIERARLDVFKELLAPAGVEPLHVRQVEVTDVILMLVASNRGISVLPDWVMRQLHDHPEYSIKRLTENGCQRRMYIAHRETDISKPYVANFIRIAKTQAVKLQYEP